jgi:hypothetical protein
MNFLQRLARFIIKKSFNTSVWMIERFHNMKPYNEKLEELRNYPDGTLGHDMAKCLDEDKLGFVPNYESHDLKHVLLEYKMTPVDEIRMQAFMLGNGNYTFPCFAILTFGAILLPDEWTTLRKDYKRGKRSKAIFLWTIEDFAEFQTSFLRNEVIETDSNSQSILFMKSFTKFASLASLIAGVFGMLFCLPFLFSSKMEDLVGAGFPFIGGAILVVGGLYALSTLTKHEHRRYL